MYCPRDDTYRGLGVLQVTAYQAPGGSAGTSIAQLCADTLFRIQHPAQCAPAAPTQTYAPPPPPPPPAYVPGPTVDPPTAEPVWIAPPAAGVLETAQQILGAGPADPLEPTILTIGSGGWGGGSVTVDSPDVIVEGEPRGFGLLEAAIGAGLAWVLANSYKSRRRRR